MRTNEHGNIVGSQAAFAESMRPCEQASDLRGDVLVDQRLAVLLLELAIADG